MSIVKVDYDKSVAYSVFAVQLLQRLMIETMADSSSLVELSLRNIRTKWSILS